MDRLYFEPAHCGLHVIGQFLQVTCSAGGFGGGAIFFRHLSNLFHLAGNVITGGSDCAHPGDLTLSIISPRSMSGTVRSYYSIIQR